MEAIGKIAMDNSMIFEGVKTPSTTDAYLPSEENTIKGEPDFESMDNRANGLIISTGQISTQKEARSMFTMCYQLVP